VSQILQKTNKPHMLKTPEIQDVLSHWSHLSDGLVYSPKDYYASLTKRIESYEVKGLKLNEVTFSQGGYFTKKRVYLRATYGDLIFDICGAPFGSTTFFFSYWMGQKRMHGCFGIIITLLLSVPILGGILEKNLSPMTYYQQDTAQMFQSLIHGIVLQTVDEIINETEIPPLSEEQRVADTKKLSTI